MEKNSNRKDKRYPIGGRIEFNREANKYIGYISNVSFGGILAEFARETSNIKEGENHKVWIHDIFSDKKYLYNSRVVRVSEKEIAFYFFMPLKDTKKYLIKEWINIHKNPSLCV